MIAKSFIAWKFQEPLPGKAIIRRKIIPEGGGLGAFAITQDITQDNNAHGQPDPAAFQITGPGSTWQIIHDLDGLLIGGSNSWTQAIMKIRNNKKSDIEFLGPGN
jgi:hypothetical protein